MAPLNAPAKVLVTGASGFIAIWVVRMFLEHGYTVVGTVRSKPKGEYLEQLFAKDGYGNERFSFFVVEDMEREGAFDEAVVGVDAVEHVASPVMLQSDDPQDLIGPAVKGTTGILESIMKHGSNVKRVVVTSSAATVVNQVPLPPGDIMDESCWNVTSTKEVEEKGKDAPGIHKYRASKVFAERAAWKFVEDNNDSISFDLVTILPAMVWGPIIHDVPTSDALNSSTVNFRSNVLTPERSEAELVAPAYLFGAWVDVRDVAAIHVLALAHPAAGGERFITCSKPASLQNFLDAINEAYPDRPGIPKGYPGKGVMDQAPIQLVGSKAEKTFDYKFRTYQDTAPATYLSLADRGLEHPT